MEHKTQYFSHQWVVHSGLDILKEIFWVNEFDLYKYCSISGLQPVITEDNVKIIFCDQ